MNENQKEKIWRQILWIKKNKVYSYNKQQEKMFDIIEYLLKRNIKK